VRTAVDGLDADTREALGIAGFAPLATEDYRLIAARMPATP
jgi:hypothetical protein